MISQYADDLIDSLISDHKEVVILSRKDLNAVFFSRFAEYLSSNPSLQQLLLNGSGVCDESIALIAPALQKCPSLLVLNLSGNDITDNGMRILSKYIHFNRALRSLSLGLNEFGDTGLKYIGESLRGHTSIMHLELYCNKISHKGISDIKAIVKRNTAIASLKLYDNKIKDRGIISLSSMLKLNKSLRELNVAHNGIGNVGAVSFAKAIKLNKGLVKFSVSQNKFDQLGAAKLDEAVIANPNILFAYYDGRSQDVVDLLVYRVKKIRHLIALVSDQNLEMFAFQTSGLFSCSMQMHYLASKENIVSSDEKLFYEDRKYLLLYRYVGLIYPICNMPLDISKHIIGYLSDNDKEALWTVIRGTQISRELVATAYNTISI